MGRLFFLVGLPRSGKSTIANAWQNDEIEFIADHIAYKKRGEKRRKVIVSADAVRLSFGHRFNKDVEHLVWSTVETMVKTYLLMEYDVLLDETNTTQQRIKQIFRWDKNAQWAYISTDVATCMSRAVETEQSDLIPIIERMYCDLQQLTNEEKITRNGLQQAIERYRPK